MTFPKLSFQKSLNKEYKKTDKEETIPLLTETIVDFQDPSSYFDQEAYHKQLQQIGYEDNTLCKLLFFWICVFMILIITVGIREMNEGNFITASPLDIKEKLSCVYQFCVQM